MPIYEYICDACNETYDALQKMSDVPLVDCPVCGKPELKKKLSAPSFRLSGSGWYETDFKSGAKRNVTDASSSSSSAASDCSTAGCTACK